MKRILILALLSMAAGAGNAQQTVDVRKFGTFATFSSTTASTTFGQPIASLVVLIPEQRLRWAIRSKPGCVTYHRPSRNWRSPRQQRGRALRRSSPDY